jgi:hypothetical protein
MALHVAGGIGNWMFGSCFQSWQLPAFSIIQGIVLQTAGIGVDSGSGQVDCSWQYVMFAAALLVHHGPSDG